MGVSSLLPSLLIYSIISLYQYGLMSLPYTLGYNLILLSFVTQIVPALATVSSFRWFLCSFDMLQLFVCVHRCADAHMYDTHMFELFLILWD